MPGALDEYDDYVAVLTQHIKLRGLSLSKGMQIIYPNLH